MNSTKNYEHLDRWLLQVVITCFIFVYTLAPELGNAGNVSSNSSLFSKVSRNCAKLQKKSITFKARHLRSKDLIIKENIRSTRKRTVFYVNTNIFRRLPPYVGEFELYSFCGRESFSNLSGQKLIFEADCWALNSGRLSRSNFNRIIGWYAKNRSTSERKRAKNLYACIR